MALLDGVIAQLVATTTVHGHTSTRVYKNVLPRGYSLPALVVHKYGGVQDYDLDGPVDVREDQVQIDIYGVTSDEVDLVLEAVRSALVGFVGPLPDGTVVQGCFFERAMGMPYLAYGDKVSATNRSLIGFRFVTKRM